MLAIAIVNSDPDICIAQQSGTVTGGNSLAKTRYLRQVLASRAKMIRNDNSNRLLTRLSQALRDLGNNNNVYIKICLYM